MVVALACSSQIYAESSIATPPEKGLSIISLHPCACVLCVCHICLPPPFPEEKKDSDTNNDNKESAWAFLLIHPLPFSWRGGGRETAERASRSISIFCMRQSPFSISSYPPLPPAQEIIPHHLYEERDANESVFFVQDKANIVLHRLL